MPGIERLGRNFQIGYEEYPPQVEYEWKRITELRESVQNRIVDHYIRLKSVAKDVLFMRGFDEELNFTGFVMDTAKSILYRGGQLPTLDGELTITENRIAIVQRTGIVPCNFELNYLHEYGEHAYIFSRFRTAPDEMYFEARDKILNGTNQLLGSLNRNTIPTPYS